jgi:hypothetical protein
MRRRGLIVDALLVLQGHVRALDRASCEEMAPA